MIKRNRIAAAMAATLGLCAALPLNLFAQPLDSPSTTPAQGANRPVDIQGDGRQQAADLATTTLIRAALLQDLNLKTETILVETINGRVRLTGQVTSSANFDRAKDVVSKVEGVKDVENLLVLRQIRPQ